MKRPALIALITLLSAGAAAALWTHLVPHLQPPDVQTSHDFAVPSNSISPSSSVALTPPAAPRTTAGSPSVVGQNYGYGAVKPKPSTEYVTVIRDIRIPHGTSITKIPKGTKVLVVSRGADVVQVRFGSYSELIPTSAVAPK
jgi:hypothetical protein